MVDYSYYSLIPAAVTILFSVATHKVSLSLFLGIVSGVAVISGLSPAAFFNNFISHIYAAFADAERLEIALFVMLVGGLLEMISASGAYYALAESLARVLGNARRSRLATWFLGVLMFFDDYANVLIAGSSMRKINAVHHVSPALIAYIVDIVSEIASVAIISTWAAYEGSIMLESALKLGVKMTSSELMMSSLPYHFYTYFGIFFALLTAYSGKWLGYGLEKHMSHNAMRVEAAHSESVRLIHVAAPLATMIAFSFGGLFAVGYTRLVLAGDMDRSLMKILSKAPTIEVLLASIVISSILCVILMKKDGVMKERSYLRVFVRGKMEMFQAALIIMLSNGLAKVSGDLGTGAFITGSVGSFVAPYAVPALIFAVSSLITVATGFSWSSMAIMMPVGYQMGISSFGPGSLPLISGAVICGAISGAHLVPFSDKSVMTAAACKITPMYHVRTQFLNVMAAIVVSFFAFLAIGLSCPVILCFLIGIAVISAIHIIFAGESAKN
ncbi:MAG TPA: Na+/H+ antiporter NhaC family protein [Candidatus Wallbacteria bacterium]|nr:Na+/H+ antiporter NhaC family protein [Candidatus Wallbacteria bacterium]